MSSMEDTARKDEINLGRIGPASFLVGGLFLLISLFMIFGNKESRVPMLQSYLFGFVVFVALSMGCLALTLLHHTVKGKWGSALLRIWEAGGSATTFIVLGLMAIPIVGTVLAGDPTLYMWAPAQARTLEADPYLHHKEPYLNPTAFTIRFVIFLGFWALISWGMRKSTKRQDANGKVEEEHMRTNYAAPGLVALVLTVTFAFTDWVMSLQPHWSSTIFGAWFLVGGALFALCFSVFITTRYSNRAPYEGVIQPDLTRDFGNMMLALTMFWSYTAFSQFLIIWSGNLPEYTEFFAARREHGWNWIGLAIIPFQFFIPFMVLLSPRVKRNAKMLGAIALWIMVIRVIDIYWVVMPAFHEGARNAAGQGLMYDIFALLAFGGIWLGIFGKHIQDAPLLPVYDHRLKEVPHHA